MFGVFIGAAARKGGPSGEASALHPAVLEGVSAPAVFKAPGRAPLRRAHRRLRFAPGVVTARVVRVALCAIYALAVVWAVCLFCL